MRAEVDEFGMLCVCHRIGRGWVEVACPIVLPPGFFASSNCEIDAEGVRLHHVREAVDALNGLYEWCTKGGTDEWLKSKRTTPSTSI